MKRGDAWREAKARRLKPVSALCESCKRKSGVKVSYRLDPVNWHPEYKRLCTNCRHSLGYAVVRYGRTTHRISGSPRTERVEA